ncbi:hypothetical protein C0J52_05785 [Blattella germanica]|nr:hypothetical protein C0J52_05785 [Blattella germanica]
MKQCHLVLEGCPNKCGVTVERHAMQAHLDNECLNIRRPTTSLQPSAQPPPEINIEQWDFNSSSQRLNKQFNTERDGMPEEWNDKVVAALMVIKKALLKEENERCRAEAEWKLEMKKLNQRIQSSENYGLSNAQAQVTMVQFLELKEEVLLLKESLTEERQKRHLAEQQLAYETEKSVLLSQQIDELNQKYQEYIERNEAWKTEHIDEINRMLLEVSQERQQRLRAETELRMEAAKLEDLCFTLEQWRNQDKGERFHLEDEYRKREFDWKGQVDQHHNEVEGLKNIVEKCCDNIDEFREFLSSENVMISGLWAEQLAEVRKITERLDLLSTATETKSKELAQITQRVNECDEAIQKRVRGNNSTTCGKLLWKISEFEAKMTDAKANDTILHSPVFYSSQYGYKLRVEVRLNGLGQWTGRHMTASLQVLEGEWDPLLQWPFNQKVTLILRDQAKSPNKVNNLMKSLAEGQEKEDPAGLHVFIPHSTLQQHNYIVNDVIFLEVTVG